MDMKLINWFTNGRSTRIYRGPRPFIATKTRLRIWVRDGGRCRYCGRFGLWPGMELDHVRAWSKRGRNWRNLVLSCPPCNGRKSNHDGWIPRPLPFWRQLLDWILIVALWDWPRPEDL